MFRTKFLQFSKSSQDDLYNISCRIYIKIGNNLLKNPEIQTNKKLISYINSNETFTFNQKVTRYTKNKFVIMDTSNFNIKTRLDLEKYMKLNKIFGKK